MSEKIPCTVLVLTLNAAESLERCLKNLAPFSEILVHDGNSTDNTVEVAKRYGAKVLKQYDTEEKNVRVKDFTEIRLKQRADAQNDWVLYLDADEFLSDALVTEIGEILKTAHNKVIGKVPRQPIINGTVRTGGVFYPEIVPRLHNRIGGCTLKKGKTVHEKYEYDASFQEVVTKNPLLFPLPDVADLLRKDNRYITLEVERIRRDGIPLSRYLRWYLFREPLIVLLLCFRILLWGPRYNRKDSVPLAHDWRYVRYHWRLFRAVTGELIFRFFSSKKSKS